MRKLRAGMPVLRLAFIALLLFPVNVLAQSVADFYRAVTVNVWIVYGAGGGYDLSARVLARHMGRQIPGEPTLVARNMPGAGSLTLVADLYLKMLTVGASGAASLSAVFPCLFNAILGTKSKVFNGYTSSAAVLTVLEAGELNGFCALGLKDHPETPLVLDLAKTPEDRALLEVLVAPQVFARPFAPPSGVPRERGG